MFYQSRKWKVLALASLLAAVSAAIMGCGSEQQQKQQATPVKAVSAIQQDTPLSSEFAGQIVSKNTVNVQSKVSGNIVEKFVQGGQFVKAGQPLYRIDSRQYESAVLQAKATLAQSSATLSNAQTDLGREQLLVFSLFNEEA